MKIIAIVSAKGGVGKTTVAANLAVALARQGRRVVAADLDPQNALRLHMGHDPRGIDGLSRASLEGRAWQGIGPSPVPSLSILPYGQVTETDRPRFEHLLEQRPDWLASRLAALSQGPGDIAVVDTPPGASVYLQQALHAAHWVIVVTKADAGAYAALPQMERLIQTYCWPRPAFEGRLYIINQVDERQRLTRDLLHVMRTNSGPAILGQIADDPAVGEALAYAMDVARYAPDSQAANDLAHCAAQLLQRLPPAPPAPGAFVVHDVPAQGLLR